MKKAQREIQKAKIPKHNKNNFEKIEQNKETLEGEQFLISRDKIKQANKQSLMRNLIQNLYGRHYPLTSSNYKVREQWENKNFEFQQNIYDQIIQLETIMAEIYTIIVLISYIGIIWYVSSYRLLEIITNKEASFILMGGIFVVLMDGGVKFYFKYIFHEEQLRHFNIIKYFKIEIYLVLYFLLNILLIEYQCTQYASQMSYILDFITTILSYNRTNSLWHYLKIITSTTTFKTKFKFIDLFGTLVLLAHIFALLLYLSSNYDPQNSWTSKVLDQPLSSLDHYFYAVYFAITTMLTIGYGDLTPSNKAQTCAVLVIQIVGVAAFSYIINEIGFTMSVLRKEEEQMEQSLSTLLKMSKFYRLQKDLTDFAKAHLISNRKSIEMIYPQDETKVLSQLNDDLRQTIIFENGLSVVKSCVFFLCHWTKYFQVEISKKLIKKILHPNESLIQLPGKQKIYIIKSGKLEIYTNRNSNYKQHFKKLLKTIAPQPSKRISNNIYGYTSIISSRPVKLSAISKDFTCAFMLSKQHFLSCVHENKYDQEYYYEIKARIEECRCVEGWQTPAVLNMREHYSPSEIFIIKRDQSNCEQWRNKRKFKFRMERYCKGPLLRENRENGLKETVDKKSAPLLQTITLNNLRQPQSQLVDKSECLLYKFENVKEYYNYFKKSNISNVLSNFQRKNFVNFSQDNRASFVPYFHQITGKFQDSIVQM